MTIKGMYVIADFSKEPDCCKETRKKVLEEFENLNGWFKSDFTDNKNMDELIITRIDWERFKVQQLEVKG